MSDDVTLVPIAWLKAAGALFAALVFGAFVLGRCSAGDETPLPPKVQANVDRHVASSVADTVTTHRLERDTAAIGKKYRAEAAARVSAEAAARVSSARADSFAAAAVLATTAADSAAEWQKAYTERTHEADSLTWAVHLAGAQLQTAAAHQAATDTIALVWKTHALRADTVIAQLLPLAQHRDQCKIAWVINCPTRKQAFVGGLLAGATGYALATGKIKIPIALKF